MKNKVFKTIKCLTFLQFVLAGGFALAQGENSPLQSPSTLNGVGTINLQQDFSKIKLQVPELKDLQLDFILDLEGIKTIQMPEGPRTGGGGNSCALVVKTATDKLSKLIQNGAFDSILKAQEIEKLQTSMNKAHIYTAKSLILNKQRKDAINYPAQQIIVMDTFFCDYKLSEMSNQSLSLLVHEYLGLARIDDTQYQVSQKVLKTLQEKTFEDNKFSLMALNELTNDEQGKKSCFNGKVRKTKQDMLDSNGRMQEQKFEYQITEAFAEESRGDLLKYARFFDKMGNPIEYKNGANGLTTQARTRVFLVLARYGSSTTGSSLTGSKGFKVSVTENTPVRFVVDESSELGTKNEKYLTPKFELTCEALEALDFE